MRNGWYRESYRHSLAARGISTSKRHSYKVILGSNFVMSNQPIALKNPEDDPLREQKHKLMDMWSANPDKYFEKAFRHRGADQYADFLGNEFSKKRASAEIDSYFKGPPYYARLYSGEQDKAATVGPFNTIEEYDDFMVKMRKMQKKSFLNDIHSDNFPMKRGDLDYPPVDPKLVLSQKNPLDALFGVDDFDDGEFQFSGKTPLWQSHGEKEMIEVEPIRGVGPKKFVQVLKNRPWMGEVPDKDDFGNLITDEFVDGETDITRGGSININGAKFKGPDVNTWGLMSPESFRIHGKGLGYGKGQRYKKIDGEFYAIEGSADHEVWK